MENLLNTNITTIERLMLRGIEMEKPRKSVMAILVAIIVILSFLGPTFFKSVQATSDPEEWYMTVPGVLDSDYYTLYPYESKSLKIGLSKYGELINSANNVGLEYDEVDPFAPPAGSAIGSISKVMWVQGWFINITYIHSTLGSRCVWAMAVHSDTHAFGGSWIRVDFDGDYSATYGTEDPTDPGYIIGNYSAGASNFGGRKTNGTAVTEPITVLYDGPRRFVALLNTTIYDHPVYLSDSTEYDIPLVRILITVIFNKVKKEVILLKDVKSLLSEKVALKMKVQFSDRGEVDLGTQAAGYHSYFHFWTQGTGPRDDFPEGLDTCYNASWTACQTEPADTLSAHGPEPLAAGKYDVAQAINPTAGYVWAAAFWPSLSDWSIDGWNEWAKSLTPADPHWIDADPAVGEPKIPFYIGEWDFWIWATTFYPGDPIQFRGVTVYVVTDLHDGDDADIDYGHTNVIDREVKYQLDEIFNPWDLVSAVHKDTTRWVEFFNGDGVTKSFTLALTPISAGWDEYCSFAERVLVNGVLQIPNRAGRTAWKTGQTYTYTLSGKTITFDVAPPTGTENIKVLYSTDDVYEVVDGKRFGPGRYEWFVVGRDAHSVDSLGAGYVTAAFKQKNVTIGRGGMDMNYLEYDIQSVPSVMHKFGTANAWADYFDGVKATVLDTSLPGDRAALKDDWCHTWPITSSNMITIGGPLINVLTGYLNEFTDAYYGTSGYAYYGTGAINALTCWGKNYYYSSDSTGYAVISTYKDINGTVVLSIWGVWGRDTYYATQWFHDNIEQLQGSPRCLTSIILEIDYTDPEHPTFTVVECLGTISEIEWVHGEETKGGIHDP